MLQPPRFLIEGYLLWTDLRTPVKTQYTISMARRIPGT